MRLTVLSTEINAVCLQALCWGRNNLPADLLLGGYLSTKQRILDLAGVISCYRSLINSLANSGLANSLTHLLGQQVNILFVASLWGVVQLYQSQRLRGDTQALVTNTLMPTSLWIWNTKLIMSTYVKGIVLPGWWRWWRAQRWAQWNSWGSADDPV